MRTIAVLNQKGGVGKTTTTVNAAAALAAMGQRVVVIDLDPQAHLTIHLGIEPETLKGGSYEVLTQSAGFEESLMMTRPNLWLLAADINLVGAETELVNVVGREIVLREAMAASVDKFDYCLIDCAPSLGLLSLNALAAAEEVLIPLQPHFLALQGFGKLLQTVDLVNRRINPSLKVTGVLLCMFDTRASLPNEVRADIERFLEAARGTGCAWSEAQVLPAFIRRNIKLAEAPSYGRTIFEYDPTCNGAEDYKAVGRFFLGLEAQEESQAEAEDQAETLALDEVEPAAGVCEPDVAVSDESQEPRIEVEAELSAMAEPELDEILESVESVEDQPVEEPSCGDESSDQVEIESEITPGGDSWSRPSELAAALESSEANNSPVEVAPEGSSQEDHNIRMDTEVRESYPWQISPSQETVTPADTELSYSTDTMEQSESETEAVQDVESSPESEQQDAVESPEGRRPIEIREVPPVPPIRRYTPPPLQRFPIPPSKRQENV